MSATSITAEALKLEPVATEKPIGQWGLAWRRLRRHKLAMIGLVMLVVIVFVSLTAELIAPYDFEEIDLDRTYAPLFAPGAPGQADAPPGHRHAWGATLHRVCSTPGASRCAWR